MYEKQPRKYSSIIFVMILLGLGVYHVYAVGQLKEDVKKAEEDIGNLKQVQIDYSAQNKALSEELEELESTHLQELEKIETYEEKMENLEEDIQNKESEIDKLNQDLQAKREREEEEAKLAKANNSSDNNNDKSAVLSSNKSSNYEQNTGSVSTSASSVSSNRTLGSFKVTSYAIGDGMTPSTVTANGTNVANTIYSPEGYRIIAVDTSVIPMNTVVRVNMNGQSFLAKSSDTGSAIVGNKIDLLVNSPSEAISNGVQEATIEIVN